MMRVSVHLRRMASQKTTPVTLENLFRFGRQAHGDKAQRLRNAQFLHSELQIRLAQRILELEALPLGLPHTEPIQNVIGWYNDYFERVSEAPFPSSDEDEEDFTDLLRFILQNNAEVIETTSRGVLEVRSERKGFSIEDQQLLDTVLNRFYIARIGLRFLIEHHIASRDPKPGFAGIIESDCKPASLIEDAASEARSLCERYFGIAPRAVIKQVQVKRNPKHDDVTFTYVPVHLRYMLLEVLKNSVKAVTEHWGPELDEDEFPPVEVMVVSGPNDVTIRVSDQGGGIERAKLPLIWSYLHSTAKDPRIQAELMTEGRTSPVLAGYGVGLPLSRLYARYFGGDLDVKSLEGFGTDAYLHLSRLGHNCENLPEHVMRSPAEADSTLQRGNSQLFFFGNRREWKESALLGNSRDYYEFEGKKD